MNQYNSIRNQHCPNKNCPYYRRKLDNKVSVHSKKDQRFQCGYCKKTWAGYKDEPYFRLRAPREKLQLAKILYEAGRSVREIAREVGVSPSTVQRWKALFERENNQN